MTKDECSKVYAYSDTAPKEPTKWPPQPRTPPPPWHPPRDRRTCRQRGGRSGVGL